MYSRIFSEKADFRASLVVRQRAACKDIFHVPVRFNDTVKLATILASESLASIRSQCPQLSDYLNLCMGVSYQPCLPEHI